MPKKDFSFHYDLKTKTGKMKLGNKYIDLNFTSKKCSLKKTSSGGIGYGLHLI